MNQTKLQNASSGHINLMCCRLLADVCREEEQCHFHFITDLLPGIFGRDRNDHRLSGSFNVSDIFD